MADQRAEDNSVSGVCRVGHQSNDGCCEVGVESACTTGAAGTVGRHVEINVCVDISVRSQYKCGRE